MPFPQMERMMETTTMSPQMEKKLKTVKRRRMEREPRTRKQRVMLKVERKRGKISLHRWSLEL